MAKKIDEAEVKKECPSCGLGVALDATICEFCGWDFEEEDEWILQIEKLERDLMLEKRKFEPGTVNQKIESTLHAPTLERIEAIRASQAKAEVKTAPAPPAHPRQERAFEARAKAIAAKTEVVEPEELPVRPTRVAPPAPPPAAPVAQAAEPRVRRVRTVKTAPAPQPEMAPEEEGAQSKKTRVVRKMKTD